MGRKRVTSIDEAKPAEEKPKKGKRALVKTGKEHGRITDMGAVALAEAEEIKKREIEAAREKAEAKREKKARPIRQRSGRYREALAKVDRGKAYSVDEAVKLVKDTALARFDGTVEVHINATEKVSGSVRLPHPTGKEQKVAIADDKLLEKIEAGKIDFDILIASPEMMPKLAKYAKTLGPRGLMPNPKAGTIAEDPQEATKKFSGAQIRFKTEAKEPLIHLTLGKVSDKAEELAENLQAIIDEIGPGKIKKLTLTSTMGPGIRVDVTA